MFSKRWHRFRLRDKRIQFRALFHAVRRLKTLQLRSGSEGDVFMAGNCQLSWSLHPACGDHSHSFAASHLHVRRKRWRNIQIFQEMCVIRLRSSFLKKMLRDRPFIDATEQKIKIFLDISKRFRESFSLWFLELICKVPSTLHGRFFLEKKWKRLCTDNRAQRCFYATEAVKNCYNITPNRSSFNYRFKSAYRPRWIFARQFNGQLSRFREQQWSKFIGHGAEHVCWSKKSHGNVQNQQPVDHLDREGAWDYKIYIERQKQINSEWENTSS